MPDDIIPFPTPASLCLACGDRLAVEPTTEPGFCSETCRARDDAIESMLRASLFRAFLHGVRFARERPATEDEAADLHAEFMRWIRARA